MRTFRFRTLDALALVTLVSLLLGAYLTGFRMRAPRFLTGDFDDYYETSLVEIAPEKSLHNLPPQTLDERLRALGSGGGSVAEKKYAIRQFGTGQYKTVRRIDWLRLSYDLAFTASTIVLMLILAREMRRVRQSPSPT